MNYRMAELRDMDGIIDHINMVFSMTHRPHNFEQMLPKVYGPQRRLPEIHLLAEEQGRLCGCLAMLEYPLRVADTTLQLGYMGSMAVHSRARGKGTMGELMRRQVERAKELGKDLLVLGGQRQRYERHGFTPTGGGCSYLITAANVRHALSEACAEQISFRPMQKEDEKEAFDLYDGQWVTGARTREDFIIHLVSYEQRPWTILCDDRFSGYLVCSGDQREICEMLVAEEDLILPVVKAWFASNNLRSVTVKTAPYDVALNQALAGICEGYSLGQSHSLRLLNPGKVIKAYMELKGRYMPMEDGLFRIGYGEYGTYRICVKQGIVSVEPCMEKPDADCTELEAINLLFGHNIFAVPEKTAPAGWFPLPFYLPCPDTF